MAPGGAVVVPSDRKAAILARLDVSVSLSLPFRSFWRLLLVGGSSFYRVDEGWSWFRGFCNQGKGPGWLQGGVNSCLGAPLAL